MHLQAVAAIYRGTATQTFSLQLAKGQRDRAGEDEVASRLLLHALCTASLAQGSFDIPLLLQGDEHVKVWECGALITPCCFGLATAQLLTWACTSVCSVCYGFCKTKCERNCADAVMLQGAAPAGSG